MKRLNEQLLQIIVDRLLENNITLSNTEINTISLKIVRLCKAVFLNNTKENQLSCISIVDAQIQFIAMTHLNRQNLNDAMTDLKSSLMQSNLDTVSSSTHKNDLIKFGKWYSKDECTRDTPEAWTSIVDRYLSDNKTDIKDYVYEYEMFIDDKDSPFELNSWIPIATDRIKDLDRIEHYIETGLIRRITK